MPGMPIRVAVLGALCVFFVACGTVPEPDRQALPEPAASGSTVEPDAVTEPRSTGAGTPTSASGEPTESSATNHTTPRARTSEASSSDPTRISEQSSSERSTWERSTSERSSPAGSSTASRPPPEDTDAPLPRTSEGSRPRAVEVSGPTLEGRYREAPLTFEARGLKCTPFTNGAYAGDARAAQIPVTVRGLRIGQQTPAGEPAFALAAVDDIAACAIEDLEIAPDCTGATLPPYTDEQPVACAVAIAFQSDRDHLAQLLLDIEGTCTDATSRPCDTPEVAALGPSPEAPVAVTWTVRKYVNACPENPPAGIGGNCPLGRYGD